MELWVEPSTLQLLSHDSVEIKTWIVWAQFNMELEIRMVRSYISYGLMYGVKFWTLNNAICEMWACRRMLKISWMNRVINDEIMNKMRKETKICNTVKKKKKKVVTDESYANDRPNNKVIMANMIANIDRTHMPL